MKNIIVLGVLMASTLFSCKEDKRVLSIQLKQVAESEEPILPVYFIAGRVQDTAGYAASKPFEISNAVFDKLASIIKKELPLSGSVHGITPFFSITIIEDTARAVHAVDTRETMINLLYQFKRVADEDVTIDESGQLDEILHRLQ